MKLKVNHQELNDVATSLKEDSILLNEEIEKIIKKIGELKVVWQGTDSEIFCNKFAEYMKNTKEVSELYMYLSDFITKIDTNYKELDLEYSQKLKEVTVANE